MNKFSLNKKVVLVTGGGGLLAIQHANSVLKNSGKLVLIDIDPNKLNKNVKKLEKKFKKKIFKYICDITSENDVINLKKKLEKSKMIPDILINNAAIDFKPKKENKGLNRLENFSVENLKNEINVGLIGAVICTKIFGNEMSKKKKGVILNIGSDLSFISPDQNLYKLEKNKRKLSDVKPVSYSIIKHGILGLTKYTATYWANKNVRCNLLAPGGIFNNQPKEFLKKIKRVIPMGRLANQNEYEEAIIFLISDASSYMNGASLIVDGGRTAL